MRQEEAEEKLNEGVVWYGLVGLRPQRVQEVFLTQEAKASQECPFWEGKVIQLKWARWVQDQTNVRDGGREAKTSFTQADTNTPERRISASWRLMCTSRSCKTSVMRYRRFQLMWWKQTELSLISH